MEKPIIFSGEVVRAILDGRKTQTRRVINFPARAYTPDLSWIASVNPDGAGGWVAWGPNPVTDDFSRTAYPYSGGIKCPYGKPGDLLWVRETWLEMDRGGWCDPSKPKWWFDDCYNRVNAIAYRANCDAESEKIRREYGYKWRSPIVMPRWASRLTLSIVDVRVERVQDITHFGAMSEGITYDYASPGGGTIMQFAKLWDSINAKRGYPWGSNPWVWVIEFEKVQQ